MKLGWLLSGILLVLQTACATSTLPPLKEDMGEDYTRDAATCRAEVGLDQAGRNDPGAYRAQALFNRCMRYRGWKEQ